MSFPPKGFIAAMIVIPLLGVVSFIIVAVLIYKYLSKHGFPAINFNAPPAAPATAMPPYLTTEMPTMENFLKELAREKPLRFSPQHLAGFTGNYATKLGAGGFGEVYKGSLPNGVAVAVKVLAGNLDKRVEEQFMAEVGTIGRTYHLHLVRLYGFCFDAALRALVYEYMENGSLDRYLYSKDQDISWGRLHEIAIGTAKGIRYLHEDCRERIIHYDIKPGNILLDSNFTPKVADFGLAKLMSRELSHMSMAGGRGTPGYAAPEMWTPSSPVTHKCDVYSFGMLLLEIVGRRRNFRVSATGSQQWFPKVVYDKFEGGELAEIVSSCGIEEEDREQAERMCRVALWCVQHSAEARPPMSKVVKMLEGEMEITPPTNPFQHMYATGTGFDLWGESDTDAPSSSGVSDDTTPVLRNYEIEIASAE